MVERIPCTVYMYSAANSVYNFSYPGTAILMLRHVKFFFFNKWKQKLKTRKHKKKKEEEE